MDTVQIFEFSFRKTEIIENAKGFFDRKYSLNPTMPFKQSMQPNASMTSSSQTSGRSTVRRYGKNKTRSSITMTR